MFRIVTMFKLRPSTFACNNRGQHVMMYLRATWLSPNRSCIPVLRKPQSGFGCASERGFRWSASTMAIKEPSNQLKARQEALMKKGLPKKKSIPGVKHVLLVASGKGGVGKSTTAVNLAVALSKHKSAPSLGILDADIFGPSLPTMMNVSGSPQLTAEDKMLPVVNFGIKCMSIGLLVDPDQAVVWRGPMVMGALGKLLNQTDWGKLDVLVVDTPPGTGDILLSLAQSIQISGAVIVSTPQKVSLSDATKGIDMFKKVNIPVLGLVENMSSFVCGSCGSTTHIFGKQGLKDLADKTGTCIIGEVPLDPSIMQGSDSGKPLLLSNPSSTASQVYTNMANLVLEQLEKEALGS